MYISRKFRSRSECFVSCGAEVERGVGTWNASDTCKLQCTPESNVMNAISERGMTMTGKESSRVLLIVTRFERGTLGGLSE